jgi:serine phosphatase RsbU (regulator of sigma subunit)/pSer/pThr/pTyr-binding forkhead associated (FHA) protein
LAYLVIFYLDKKKDVYEIDRRFTSIGRALENDLVIYDPSVSRRHCLLEKSEDAHLIRDLGSSWGTTVNDQAIMEHRLQDGDRIEIGGTSIFFLVKKEDVLRLGIPLEAAEEKVPADKGKMDIPSSFKATMEREVPQVYFDELDETMVPQVPAWLKSKPPMPPEEPVIAIKEVEEEKAPAKKAKAAGEKAPTGEEAVAARAAALAEVPPEAKGATRADLEIEIEKQRREIKSLRRLLDAARGMVGQTEMKRLQEIVTDSGIRIMSGDRGFLAGLEEEEVKFLAARSLSVKPVGEEDFDLAARICREVVSEGKPIMTADATEAKPSKLYKGAGDLGVGSIACVPMKIGEEILGCLYVDSYRKGFFGEAKFSILQMLGVHAARVLESAEELKDDRKQDRIRLERKFAGAIQKGILPRQVPEVEGVEVFGWMTTGREVRGDFYDFIPQDLDGSLLIGIGDVASKGLPAAVAMIMARSYLRGLAEDYTAPKDILVKLNKLLATDLKKEIFLSFLLLKYRKEQKGPIFCSAGHEHILYYKAKTGECKAIKPGGLVLGVLPAVESTLKQKAIPMESGDALVLYTDGAVKVKNKKEEEFGLKALLKATKKYGKLNAKELLQSLLGEILRFKGRAEQEDDITLITIKKQ